MWASRIAILPNMEPDDRRRMWQEILQLAQTGQRPVSYQSGDRDANIRMIGSMVATMGLGWLDKHPLAVSTLKQYNVTPTESAEQWRQWSAEMFSRDFFANNADTNDEASDESQAPGMYTTTTITQ